ncbi:MAG: DNA polymerase III subunit gamma/tau [Thermodesulfobacteriota bacterium]
MSASHLTLKYRPQCFADVAGQDTVRSILSRAAATDKVAPAYIFSGTRGVGKTTLARIFAKAVNCEKGPAPEPCNKCSRCRQITAGAAVDVAEIDAASHTGVDNIRSLKEDVGFAPLECRYKVFIIDEAHMLSKAAFNALLKTLEEPPPRVTFILATTEPHKFPATILSRSQHYVFSRLTQKELEARLAWVMEREGLEYDPRALSLVARRGSGSVRDALSLLGQVLALGGGRLTEADVRGVLGLAGQDTYFSLMEALQARDCVAVSTLLRDILDQGLDLGFFLRELTSSFRTMFLLSQAGEAAFPILDLSEEEARAWLDWARRFDLAHIHACWQLTLEGQRRVKDSLEPALALELLLLNLAYLPQLLSLEEASAPDGRAAGGGSGGGSAPRTAPRPAPAAPAAPPARRAAPQATPPAREPDPAPAAASPAGPPTWEGFKAFYAERTGACPMTLQKSTAQVGEEGVVVECQNQAVRDQLRENGVARLAGEYFGPSLPVEFRYADVKRKTHQDLKVEAEGHPAVTALKERFGARVVNVVPRPDRSS